MMSCLDVSFTTFTSPVPRPSLLEPGYHGRLAYIKTTVDAALPIVAQDIFIQGSGAKMIIRDIEGPHCVQLSHTRKLRDIIVGLAKDFENL